MGGGGGGGGGRKKNRQGKNSKLHISPTNYRLLVAQQRPYEKDQLLTKNAGEFLEKVRRVDH